MMKTVLKRSISFLLCLCFLATGTIVFAAQPRAVACGNCSQGRLLEMTRDETQMFNSNCLHGWVGYNDAIKTVYRRTYYECNSCRIHIPLSETIISRVAICTKTGEVYPF